MNSLTKGRNLKRDVPIAIMFCFFFFFAIFSYFWYDEVISEGALDFQRLTGFSGRWMIAIGMISLLGIHARRISKKQRDWQYSVLMLIPFAAVVLSGFFTEGGRQGQIFRWWFTTFEAPASYAGAHLSWFYSTWAYFRVVRARDLRTLIFTIVFCLFCLAYSPLGNVILPIALPITDVISDVFLVGLQRAMLLTGLGAGIAMTIRTLLGMEKGWLGALGRALPTLPGQRSDKEQ